MAPNACKLLCLVLLFAFIIHGDGNCQLNDLSVKQSKTGKLVQNKPEWEFQYTKLSCVGFQSVTPVDTSVLSKSGDMCLLNAGNFTMPHVDFVFQYVWDTSFDLKVLDSVIVCS
ncbi:hypothetical protein EUTSA_v10027554mg [Eutrema salsugineum]|uniref:Uncharacterized protein n=1 Tax=Eutrema salsugineum TaxID=72664 RepID=V4MFB8_EUTSA|nr:hypothetical protein EUTSA_v10027554mg [Eutrema salsugineum]